MDSDILWIVILMSKLQAVISFKFGRWLSMGNNSPPAYISGTVTKSMTFGILNLAGGLVWETTLHPLMLVAL